MRDYASKRIVTIPFEILIKNGLDQLIEKPEKIIEAIKKALKTRLSYIDPNLQLSEDEPFFDIVPFEDLIIDAASLTSDYDRKLVFIKGVVTRVGQLRHKVKDYVYECKSCGKKHHKNRRLTRCPFCGSTSIKVVEKKIVDVQQLTLGDGIICECRKPWVPIRDFINQGDEIRVTGICEIADGKVTIYVIGLEKLGEAETFWKYFDDRGRFIPKRLAEEIMEQYHFITLRDSDEIYVYRNGYYQPFGEQVIRVECRKRLGEEYRKNRAAEVIDYIKTCTYREIEEPPLWLVNLENGVLDLRDLSLHEHSPNYVFFNKIPVKYDPNADCPKIKKFLEEITGSKEDLETLIEFIGYCLWRKYPIAKALMLVGDGANGKSTFLNLVKRLLGSWNVASRSLQELEENRFAKADLFGKLANIYADLPDEALRHTGTFKMLTGGDPITAEKKFQHSFQFTNYAKLLFSTNKVPEVYGDESEGFFRRWIIITFPNKFEGDNADPNILEKLTTEEELSGLLNLAIKALKRLLERGEFTHSRSTQEIREDYIRKSSPVGAFVMDCIENDPDAFIPKKELYKIFALYCRVKKLPAVSADTFYKSLLKHISLADYRPKLAGTRVTAFKGIRYSSKILSLLAEAREAGLSDASSVSAVFYSLIERQKDYEELGCSITPIDQIHIKVEYKVDTPDRHDSSEDVEYRLICPRCLDDVRKTSIFIETVDHRAGLGLCEFCGEKNAEFVIKVRKGGW